MKRYQAQIMALSMFAFGLLVLMPAWWRFY